MDSSLSSLQQKKTGERGIGEIVSINGALIEARCHLIDIPLVYDILECRTASTAVTGKMIVIQRLYDGHFRGLLFFGSIEPGGTIHRPDGNDSKPDPIPEQLLAQAVESMRGKRQNKLIETGIKIIDFFCPLVGGSTVGIFGREGLGRAVLVQELIKRLREGNEKLILFFYNTHAHLFGTREMLEKDPLFAIDIHDNLQTSWILHGRATDPNYALLSNYLDCGIFFSPIKAKQNKWPAIDPLYCRSSSLSEEIVGCRHLLLANHAHDVLEKANKLMRDPDYLEQLALGATHIGHQDFEEKYRQRFDKLRSIDQGIVKKALLLDQFFTQPFHVAEAYTGVPGLSTPLSENLNRIERILDSEVELPDGEIRFF